MKSPSLLPFRFRSLLFSHNKQSHGGDILVIPVERRAVIYLHLPLRSYFSLLRRQATWDLSLLQLRIDSPA